MNFNYGEQSSPKYNPKGCTWVFAFFILQLTKNLMKKRKSTRKQAAVMFREKTAIRENQHD